MELMFYVDRTLIGFPMSAPDVVEYMCLDASEKIVALAIGTVVILHELRTGKILLQVEGHAGLVTACAFAPHVPHVMITVSEDRTFVIWDMRNGSALYRSAIETASPFVGLAVDPVRPRMTCGTLDGRLLTYDITIAEACRLIHTVDANTIKRRLSSDDDTATTTMSGSVLSMCYAPSTWISQTATFGLSSTLFVGTPSAVVQIDMNSYEGEIVLTVGDEQFLTAGAVALCAYDQTLLCTNGHAFEAILSVHAAQRPVTEDFRDSVLMLQQQQQPRQTFVHPGVADSQQDADGISVFASIAMEASTTDSTPKQPATAKPAKPAGARKGSVPADKPVTFHAKVKSSGYGKEAPVTRMFVPNFSRKPKPKPKKPEGAKGVLLHEYPSDSAPPQYIQRKHLICNPVHNSAIIRIAFSGNAKRLATCSFDSTARVLRVPVAANKGEASTFLGHDGAVNSVMFSHGSKLLLTAGSDGTARMWAVGKGGDPLLIFRPPECDGVRFARFFQLDRYAVLAAGSDLRIYKFAIDEKPRSDVKGQQSTYKLLQRHSMEAQNLVTFACVNGFMSNLVLCAGSNRTVSVYDAAVNKTVASFEDAHSRPVHTIAMAAASAVCASIPPSQYELFATSAPDSTVKLWDLRQQKCVQLLTGHTNRGVHPVGIALSPCLRYAASGSEDRAVYVFDLRAGSFLHRLGGHSDVVSDVAFNPHHPQLATASFDGTLRFFSDIDKEPLVRS
eukprot:TRINITY_DN2459_c0_g1_i4.p1 TRINITY_DN2459_c0_g1~~TRINITY_DN2459_c0_g1_i4.p1  ORF type:complete len:730 (-),score=168.58 TRINITY_DN2459_c0_g1_i4:73-2262(-)